MDFSWRTLARGADRSLPAGRYAADAIDQHQGGWCGSCYLVAVVQCVEDRASILATRRSSWWLAAPQRVRLDLQAVLDHYQDASTPGWNACHGGLPLEVFECLASRACPLRLIDAPTRLLGFPQRRTTTLLGNAPYVVLDARRLPETSVRESLRRDGPVVLEVSARTLKSVDERGVVTDLTPRESNHAVCVVGWRHVDGTECWIVRNSWGSHRAPVDLPGDITCVSNEGNSCEVEWERWTGDPHDPGFCYLPMSFLPLHLHDPCPWVVATVG